MRVLFVDEVHEVLQNDLEELGFECVNYENQSFDDIKSIAHKIDGLVIRSRFPVDESFLRLCQQLKFIARSGAGMENIDIDYCNQNGIQLFNAPEGNKDAVGEHAIGMLLTLFNNIHTSNSDVKNGIWQREENRGIELGNKTVGIIGYGNNGSAFAQKLSGFGCKVLTYDKYKSNFGSNHVQESSMQDLFTNADIISFHIPQNEETKFMADETFFNSFEKPIFVVNLARGKIIKTSALVNAIKNKQVIGACLDVLEYEKSSFENMFDNNDIPKDFKFLLESERVLLTPHIGGWTHESYYKLSKVLSDKINNWLKNNY